MTAGVVAEVWRSKRPWAATARRVAGLHHTDGVEDVVFSADSRLIGTASTDGTARVWASSTGELVAELRGHASGVESLGFSASGRYVATVGGDLTLRLWDLGEERALRGPHRRGRRCGADVGIAGRCRRGGGRAEGLGHAQRAGADAARPRPAASTSIALGAGDRALVGYASADRESGRAALLDLRTGRGHGEMKATTPCSTWSLRRVRWPGGDVARPRFVDNLYQGGVRLWAVRREPRRPSRGGPPSPARSADGAR